MSILQLIRAFIGVVVASCSLVFAGGERGDGGVAPPPTGPWRIERSTKVAKGAWTLANADGALVIEGARGLVLDLGGAELLGPLHAEDPSRHAGTAIVVRKSEGVVIRGGSLAGWKTGVRIEDSSDVTVEDVLVRELFAAPLESSAVVAHPRDELLRRDSGSIERTGAAFAVLRSASVKLVRCGARRGTVGVAALDAPGLEVRDGDFAYLSAYGITLWRSARATIVGTRVEAAARGAGPGAFWRGAQGSAGLLLVDSESARVGASRFVRCGTGVAAGGASMGLVLVRVDVSNALEHGVDLDGVADARLIEVTARDAGVDGLRLVATPRAWLVECVLERAGRSAVELVAGAEIVLVRSWIARSNVGLTAVDVSGLLLGSNGFQGNGLDWEVQRCRDLASAENVYDADNLLHVTQSGDGLQERERLRGIGGAVPSGRLEASVVLAYDAERVAAFELALAEFDRRFAGGLAVTRAPDMPGVPGVAGELLSEPVSFDRWGPWDPRGSRPRPAPRPHGGLFASASWDARWFSWAQGPDPRGRADARLGWRALAENPLERRFVGAWRTPFGDGARPASFPSERLGLVARSTLELEPGRYRVAITSDDGVALRVDGNVVVENWTWHAATLDRAEFTLGGGTHAFELEYFQVDGPSALVLELDRIGP
ncbi:MAG: hypothetical protein HZA52_13610 [Planctomycetes bacterium]|nr:hypothetical protein [Planctomycetota bacterium]